MGLRERLEAFRQPFAAVLSVATCRDSLGFGDLWFPPFDFNAELPRFRDNRDSGVIFETNTRVVVIEEYSDDLRYYAGGWRPDLRRFYLEQDRVAAEGNELGIFASAAAAMHFTEHYLVWQRPFSAIDSERQVCVGVTRAPA